MRYTLILLFIWLSSWLHGLAPQAQVVDLARYQQSYQDFQQRVESGQDLSGRRASDFFMELISSVAESDLPADWKWMLLKPIYQSSDAVRDAVIKNWFNLGFDRLVKINHRQERIRLLENYAEMRSGYVVSSWSSLSRGLDFKTEQWPVLQRLLGSGGAAYLPQAYSFLIADLNLMMQSNSDEAVALLTSMVIAYEKKRAEVVQKSVWAGESSGALLDKSLKWHNLSQKHWLNFANSLVPYPLAYARLLSLWVEHAPGGWENSDIQQHVLSAVKKFSMLYDAHWQAMGLNDSPASLRFECATQLIQNKRYLFAFSSRQEFAGGFTYAQCRELMSLVVKHLNLKELDVRTMLETLGKSFSADDKDDETELALAGLLLDLESNRWNEIAVRWSVLKLDLLPKHERLLLLQKLFKHGAEDVLQHGLLLGFKDWSEQEILELLNAWPVDQTENLLKYLNYLPHHLLKHRSVIKWLVKEYWDRNINEKDLKKDNMKGSSWKGPVAWCVIYWLQELKGKSVQELDELFESYCDKRLLPLQTILKSSQKEIDEVIKKIAMGQYDHTKPLHQDVGYSQLFYQFWDDNRLQDFMRVEAYRRLSQQTDVHRVSDHAQAELLYLAWEAHRLWLWINEMQAKARQLGRPLVVIENLTYGGIATAPIRHLLAENQIDLWSMKVGSTDCHHSPDMVNPELFTDEQRRFIADQQPLILVVDGSTSVGQHIRIRQKSPRWEPHFSDARQGFVNWFALWSLVMSSSQESAVKEQMGLKFPLGQVSELGNYGSYQDKQARLKQVLNSEKQATSLLEPYRMYYKHLGDSGRQMHVNEKVMQRPLPEKYDLNKGEGLNKIQGPALVFAQTAMEESEMPDFLKLYTSGYDHEPAFFDDTDFFKQMTVRLMEHGPVIERKFYSLAKQAYQKLWQLQKEYQKTSLSYPWMLFDMDGTLAQTLQPIQDDMLHELHVALKLGRRIAIVTAQTSKQIEDYFMKPIQNYLQDRDDYELLNNILVFSYQGAEGFGYQPKSERWEELSDYSQATRTWDWPGEFLRQLKELPGSQQGRYWFDFNEKPDIALPEGFVYKQQGPFYRVMHESVSKQRPAEYIIDTFSVQPEQMLVMGDQMSDHGLDYELIVKGARNVHVGENPASLGVESWSDFSHDDQGLWLIKHYQRATLHLLRTLNTLTDLKNSQAVVAIEGPTELAKAA